MNKCHQRITFHNNTAPALNDTNLNYEDGCIDTIDDRVITLDSTKAAQSDMLLAFKDVSLNSTTGVITFTLFNNTTKTIDTLLEKVAINFDYDDDPTSPHYQNLIIELEDGTYKYIDMSALITEYEFTDSSTIDFTVTSGAVSASVIDGSITATKCDPTFALAISNAESNGLKSEGYANGTQNGTPVTSGSPYYENNAKYWRDQAHAIVSNSFAGLDDVDVTGVQNGEVPIYNSTSQKWENGTINVSGKADKVSGATTGNLAGLDANGNLTDSGILGTDVRTGTVGVANGGTGATTLASGEALIGNGTSAVGTRAITNNTSKSTAPSGSTNLATMNSLLYGMQNYNNRASAVNSADTNYTTAMARAIYATTTDLTAGTTALTNGTIALVYEA